jgi:hypothetical protein
MFFIYDLLIDNCIGKAIHITIIENPAYLNILKSKRGKIFTTIFCFTTLFIKSFLWPICIIWAISPKGQRCAKIRKEKYGF